MSSSNDTSDLTDEKLKEQRRSTPASRRCPSCDHELNCNRDMDGLPAGVRFDPSDQELIQHLESMVNEGGSRAHPLIGDFIPTLQGNDGIYYTHPENLPGVTRDGVSKHFFHRTSNAYTSGTRKRRKIGLCDDVGEARWHKTGKTNPVIVGGQQKGSKKILVLYANYEKQGKPEKTSWVMHQYHLGKEEKDGELVVSKVFYQQRQLRSATATTMMEHNDEKVDVTSEAMNDMLPRYGSAVAEAADALIQLQKHQQQRQADSQSRFTSAKMSHKVGAGDPLVGDHIPSQHEVRSVLMKPVHTMSAVESTPLNTESTKVSPAAQYPSALLNNSEKQEDQQQQKKVDCERPCSSEEAMIPCQTSSEEVGVGDLLAGDQGLLHETHHIPLQHKVQSVLRKPVHTMSFIKSTPLNTESTKVSPAVQSPSALLNHGENREDQQQQKKKVDCIRPCSSEEAMIACQTNTEEDVQEASTQPKEEIQRPYYHWL